MSKAKDISPLHAYVMSPKARSLVCEENLKILPNWQNREMEGGKNFPAHVGGTVPAPFQDDTVSATPPEDGYIYSGGKKDERDCVNFTDQEMSAKLGRSFHWADHTIKVKGEKNLDFHWHYHAEHKTRGFEYWITKNNTNPDQRVTRSDLEKIGDDFYPGVPYWSHELPAKEHTSVKLPEGKTGQHTLLAIWKVADTGMGFYQAFDLDFDHTPVAGDHHHHHEG